jgi:hypothetical protein
VSEFDKSNYFVIPLYLDENGDAVILRMPLDETSRFVGGLLWKTGSKLLGEKDTGFLDHLKDLSNYTAGQAPGLSPTLGIPADVTNYAAGNNVYDDFRHNLAIPASDYAAGPSDPRVLKQFSTYEWNKLGGGVLTKLPYSDLEKPKTALSEAYGVPFLGPMLQRFVKTTHTGETERLQAVGAPGKVADARHQLDIKGYIISDVNEIQGKADPIVSRERAISLYKQLKNEGVIDPVFDSPQAFVTKYLRYASRSDANVYYDTLVSSKSLKEKVLILREIEDDFGPEKYKEFIMEGIKRGSLSESILESKLYLDKKESK